VFEYVNYYGVEKDKYLNNMEEEVHELLVDKDLDNSNFTIE